MNTRIERRSYSLEFKLEAVRMATKSNQPKTQIAEELGITSPLLYRWCRAYADLGQAAFKKDTGLTPEQQEILKAFTTAIGFIQLWATKVPRSMRCCWPIIMPLNPRLPS